MKGFWDDKKEKLKKQTPSKKRKSQKEKTNEAPTPLRRSSRMRNAPPEHPNGLAEELAERVEIRPVKRQRRPQKVQDAKNALKPAERTQLKGAPDRWIEDMREFLVKELQNSDQNVRNVIRQVSRLASGEGVTYRHWRPKGTVFYKGKCVDLSWNFESLYDEAVEFQNEHGEDLGHGWLLLHPIKKLAIFQEYCHEKGLYKEK